MLQTVSKLGKEWWREKWPEPEQSFSHCQFLTVAVFQVHRHTSPHPLVSPGEPQTSARECSLWQTSLDACSVANTAALFLSTGTSSDEGKNRSNPFLFQITCTALDVTEKTFQAPEMSLAEQGNFQYKNPHNKVQTKWKDLQLRRRTELCMALIVKHSTQSVISSLLMFFVTKMSLLDFFFS